MRSIRNVTGALLSLVAPLFLMVACMDRAESEAEENGRGPAPDVVDAEPADPRLTALLPEGIGAEAVKEGEQLFRVCVVCHGTDAAGTQLGPPLTDQAWIHGSGEFPEIANIIRQGVPEPQEYPIPMPVLGGGAFDDEEIQSLAAYVFLLSRSSPDEGPVEPDTSSVVP